MKLTLPTCCQGRGVAEIEEQTNKTKEPWLQIRYLVVFICFLGNAVNYLMRVNLSVAIVAMNLDDNGIPPAGPSGVPIYDWDATTRSTILSSFFWGYVVSNFPSGYIVQRFGIRIPFFISLILSALLTVLYVPAAALGWEWAMVTRILLGVVQGFLIPVSVSSISRWSLPEERGRMCTYTYTGQQLGTVIAMSCSGILSAWAGWPWVFYVSGAICVIVAGVWLWLVADSPAEHYLITPQERMLIETKIAEADGSQQNMNQKKMNPPWKLILKSPPYLALVVAHCAQNWGFFTLLTEIPSYMSGVLDFELAQNGLLSALPYLVMWGFGLILSWFSDWMLKQKYYSIGFSRKMLNSLAHYGSAISLIVLSFVPPEQASAVAILTVAVGVSAGTMVGYQINFVDLSPNFASTLTGVSGTLSNVMSILGPLVVGFVVTDTGNEAQWRIIFLVTAGIYVVGNTIFVMFGSGEVQPWNNPDKPLQKKDGDIQGSTETNLEVLSE